MSFLYGVVGILCFVDIRFFTVSVERIVGGRRESYVRIVRIVFLLEFKRVFLIFLIMSGLIFR